MALGKKPSALVAIAFGKKKPTAEPGVAEGYDEEETDTTGHGAAFESFASAVGIPPEGKAKAQAALKQFVRSCMQEYGAEE